MSGLWSVAGEERFLSTSLILFQDLTCLAMSVEGNGEQAKSSAGESIAVTSPWNLTCSEIATSLYIIIYIHIITHVRSFQMLSVESFYPTLHGLCNTFPAWP